MACSNTSRSRVHNHFCSSQSPKALLGRRVLTDSFKVKLSHCHVRRLPHLRAGARRRLPPDKLRRKFHRYSIPDSSLRRNGEWRSADISPITNKFVFDVNIWIPGNHWGRPSKMLKRCLLDTGANVNFISWSAFCDIGAPLRPITGAVRSIAGSRPVSGETSISFQFLSSTPYSRMSSHNGYIENFVVIAGDEQPLFDCVLGADWFFRHLEEISTMVTSK
jgi:hypothetical protein